MLADFLFGPLCTRVLSALFLHPDAAWHARELARRIGALPGSASRELVKLADAGMLTRQQIGNQGNVGFADVMQALHPVQAEVQREINPVVYRIADFNAKLAANNTWAREVVEKPKLFLIRDAHDFAKLNEDFEPDRVQHPA